MARPPGREEYTVGWVCALPIELTAARSMLDETYGRIVPEKDGEDIYHLGSIEGHNVVIACLPWRTGTNSAAALATRMRAKFEGIRFGLMVGIGGGVPDEQGNIRLGDVVVSVPRQAFGGVVQYDMGKITPTEVISTGSLDSPPHILLSAATTLASDASMGESKLCKILSQIDHIPVLRRGESSIDVLYDASYNHQGGTTCAGCHLDKQVKRSQRRRGEEVVVHYGTIASGNQVIKSAADRDKISQKLGGVLCFEMEAAGLMNNFPCLVIRGISDYADSHKNDDWHGFAAATAAAYAKELLSSIPPARVIEAARAEDVMRGTKKRDAQCTSPDYASSKRRRTENPGGSTQSLEDGATFVLHDRTRHAQTEDQINIPSKKDPKRPALSEEQKQDLLESLKFDQIDDRKNTIKRAHIKTCKWLLKSTDYLDWLDISKMNEHHGFLWIKGKAGAGKSTLMKFALERAPKGVTMNLVLSFFFNARGSTLEKSTLGAYRSLLLQLLIGFPALWHIFDSLYSATSNFNASREWSVESLKILLEEAIQSLEKVSIMCFIDALDECDEDEIRDMVQFFEHIGDLSIERGVRLLICFSSRHYPHITIRKGLELVLEGHEGHSQDLASYIETELKIGKSKKAQQIRAAIQEKAAGIFMWVVLVVDILNKESDRGRVDRLQQKLHEIPGGLHELFRDILTRDSNNKEQLVLCIQWVLFAKQPLSPEQLYYAILSGIDPDAVTAWDPDEVEPDSIRRFILDSSKGFTDVTVSKKNKKVQFIHESVRDFLLKENGLSKVWPEYKDNFPGQSHERLTQCSWNYLNIGIKTSLDVPNVLPKANSQEAIDLRLSAERHFPFLEYAVQNLFYHANLTEGHGISQANILKNIRLERWVQLNNIVEKHGIRRHHKHVSLLYVLAELDCDMLIKPHLPHEQVLKIENERYGCPLFAACALGNKGTLRVLLDAFAQQLPSEDSDHEHAEADTTASTVSKIYRDFTYAKKKSLVVNASLICPEWLIIRLLESPTDCLDIPSSDIRDMLLTASRRGYPNLVEILLRDHADVFGNATKDEALHTAVKNGNESTVRLLVSHGANIEAQEDGENAIHIASRKGFESIAIFLLDNRPDLLDNKSMKGETALYLATDKEHGVLATKLIQRGAEIHLKPSFGGSILYCASKSGLKDVVMLLLDKGAKIKSQHGELFNVLIGAIKGGNKEIVELLLEHGADVDTQGGRYSSALQEASVRGHKDIVELLLKKGNDVNIEGGQHGSALQAASFMGHKDIVELLLKNGSDTKAVVGYYGNALQVASVRGHKDIVELLLAKGADVNAEGGQYGSALQAASIKGRKDIVKLLLKNGADTKAVVGYYGSALQAASVRGHKDIVELLLTKGADVNAEGGKYGSALNAALIEGRKEIRALLIARGAK